MPMDLPALLGRTAARHSHLCPRQVLGARMGLAGLAALGVSAPVTKASAIVIVETDGCFVDGIEVSTGATVGHRTLRIHDFGKIAATFAHVPTGRAVRLAPSLSARTLAAAYAPNGLNRYHAQLQGYQRMPDNALFVIQEVTLDPSLKALLGAPGVRVRCSRCSEEIINSRQRIVEGALLCSACAGQAYYLPKSDRLVIRTPEYQELRPPSGGLHEPATQAVPAIP